LRCFITDSLHAFVIALILVVIGVAIRLSPHVIVLISLTLFSILVFGTGFPMVWLGAFNENMLTVVLALASSMYLAELFKSCKASDASIRALESLSPRLASTAIPALVGLLPMPGGAYVSATLVDSIYSKGMLRAEAKTFINFWFRHIWLTVWPLYQCVLIASYTLGWSVNAIIVKNWPIFVASILSGVLVSWRLLPKYTCSTQKRRVSDLVHLWPFASIAFLNIVLKLNVALSAIITILLFTVLYRPRLATHVRALKYSLNPSILILIVSSLIYSHALSESGVAERIHSVLGLPELTCYLLPAIIVVAVGLEFTFSAIALPVLKSFINDFTLFLVFLGGFTGCMLSPLHACLVLSSQYFKAELRRVYKYTVPATLLAIAISLAVAYPMYIHRH